MSTTVTGHEITVFLQNNFDISSCINAFLETVFQYCMAMSPPTVIQFQAQGYIDNSGTPVPTTLYILKLYCLPTNDANIATAVGTLNSCIAGLGGPLANCVDVSHLGYTF